MYPRNKPLRLSMSISVFCVFLAACGSDGQISPPELGNKTEVSNTEKNKTEVTEEPSVSSKVAIEQSLLKHRQGFAKDVKGGAGGEHVIISRLNDGSFEKALQDKGAKWIRFTPKLTGVIHIDDAINVRSSKTIDGRGADITISKSPSGGDDDEIFRFHESENFIIHNITFADIGARRRKSSGTNNYATGNILYSTNSSKIWIDHVTWSRVWDDAFSIYKASEVTIGYSSAVDQYKNILLSDTSATIYRNNFDGSTNTSWDFRNEDFEASDTRQLISRIPSVSYDSRVHVYNNYINKWNYGVEFKTGSKGIVENNYFDTKGLTREAIFLRGDNDDVCQRQNTLVDRSNNIKMTTNGDNGGDCSKPMVINYTPSLRVADQELKSDIISKAGRKNKPQW